MANSDGVNAANLLDGFLHWEYVTVLCNETEVAEYRGVALRNEFLLSHPTEKLACVLPQCGIDTVTYASNLTIAPNGSLTIRTPIFTLISEAEVPLWKPQTRWKLRFRMRSGAALIRSGAASINSISVVSGSCKLMLQGQVISPVTQALHDAELASGTKTFRFIENNQLQLGLGNLTTGTPTTFNYTASGALSSYFLHVSVSAPVGVALYDSSAITSWDLLVNGSVQGHQLGDNQFTASYSQAVAAKHWTNCNPLQQRPIYQFSFSEQPQADLIHGSNHGTIPIQGNIETFRITPAVNVANAVVTIYGNFHSHLDINYQTGSMSVHRRVL